MTDETPEEGGDEGDEGEDTEETDAPAQQEVPPVGQSPISGDPDDPNVYPDPDNPVRSP